MSVKKRGLGRGLDALLSSARPADSQAGDGDMRKLPLDVIRRGRYQPRMNMRDEQLQDLASSIRAQGVVQPIVVRPLGTPGQYEIIAGERRWRAAQMAGLHDIPALVRNVQARLIECQLVIASGSVPDRTCQALYRLVLAACAQHGVPCWVDAYGPAMIEALSGGNPPTLCKPNREEYARDRAWLASPEMHLTDGGAAVHVRHPQGRFRVVPPVITQINPIGSGDCYLAALAHARLTGLPLPEQLRYAAAAGAANAARADVARIGPHDITALADQVSVYPAADEPANEADSASASRP